MTQKRRIRSPRGLFGALALLLLIAAMLPLSSFLAGFLPGGGELPAVEPAAADDRSDGTLRVTVVGADHRDPVAGARILVERLTGGEAQAESDAEGQVVLEGLGPGPVRVEASVNGHKSETWADPSVDPEVYLA
ncbi:MAG: carboxypeptidase-like regulatory domain-containing protein, partial [Planctomycetota bacterium]